MSQVSGNWWTFFFLLAYASFATSKPLFATITSVSELYFRSRRFILLVQIKKWFLWAMATAQAAENLGDEWGLTWYLRCGLYTLIATWTHSQNLLAAAETVSLKISSHGTALIPDSCQVKQLLVSKAVLFIHLTIKWINKITINNSRSRRCYFHLLLRFPTTSEMLPLKMTR